MLVKQDNRHKWRDKLHHYDFNQ